MRKVLFPVLLFLMLAAHAVAGTWISINRECVSSDAFSRGRSAGSSLFTIIPSPMRKVLFPVLLFLMLAAHAVAAAADSVAVNIPDETLNYKYSVADIHTTFNE